MAEPQIKDQRGWSPVDFGYLDNPKMLEVLDHSPIAALMHLASILYCAQHLTDGHITPGVARRKVGGSKDDEQALIDAGMWHPEGHDCPDCPQPEPRKVYVHNFLEHNRTAEKAKRRSEAASKAARAKWDANRNADRTADGMQSALPIAMRSDENRNAEREKERKRDTTPADDAAAPPREDVEALCTLLADLIEANGSKRPTITKRWRDAARLMLDSDGRALAEAERVIRWSQADGFWKTNILSMPKLREKYDQLRLRMGATTPQQAPKPEWMKYV